MSNEVLDKTMAALNLVSEANNAMIEAITMAVKEEEEISYVVTDENDMSEEYTISENEDGVLMAYDSEGWDYKAIEDMSADELFNICANII